MHGLWIHPFYTKNVIEKKAFHLNDEICYQNDEFCCQNDKICCQNDGFMIISLTTDSCDIDKLYPE